MVAFSCTDLKASKESITFPLLEQNRSVSYKYVKTMPDFFETFTCVRKEMIDCAFIIRPCIT